MNPHAPIRTQNNWRSPNFFGFLIYRARLQIRTGSKWTCFETIPVNRVFVHSGQVSYCRGSFLRRCQKKPSKGSISTELTASDAELRRRSRGKGTWPLLSKFAIPVLRWITFRPDFENHHRKSASRRNSPPPMPISDGEAAEKVLGQFCPNRPYKCCYG